MLTLRFSVMVVLLRTNQVAGLDDLRRTCKGKAQFSSGAGAQSAASMLQAHVSTADVEGEDNQSGSSLQAAAPTPTDPPAPPEGRPFIVGAEARTAEACINSEWLEKISEVGAENMSESRRQRVGQLWAKSGAMEHASVASFARHIMQLLSLGAPADLVEQTQQAIQEEIRHAKVCYGLASFYLGRDIGPGRLNVTSAMDDENSDHYEAAIISSVIREGAIGETLAAYKARYAANVAIDPAVAEVLETISADEARHAQLAWSFLEWVMPTNAEFIKQTFEEVLAEYDVEDSPQLLTGEDIELLSFGVLTDAAHAKLGNFGKTQLLSYAVDSILRGSSPAIVNKVAEAHLLDLSFSTPTAVAV